MLLRTEELNRLIKCRTDESSERGLSSAFTMYSTGTSAYPFGGKREERPFVTKGGVDAGRVNAHRVR